MSLRTRFFIYLIAGAIMANFYGCSGLKFEKYSSKAPELNIELEYISGWQHAEDRGSYNSYVQAMFYPVEKTKAYQPLMTVLKIIPKDNSAGLENPVNDLIAKRLKYKDAQVLSRSKTKLLGVEAVVAEFSYRALENLLKANSALILFKEKDVIFKKDGNLYLLTYKNAAENYVEFSPGFDHLVKTLKFKK